MSGLIVRTSHYVRNFGYIMRNLVHKIEGLLACHDCVVVPGLGGFIMNRIDARYDKSSNLVYPAYRQVSFNSRLTFNDGLLSQAYQTEDGVSYNDAIHSIRMAVAEIQQHLSAGENILLGEIGQIRQTEDGRVIFSPLSKVSLDADAFGLEPVPCSDSYAVADNSDVREGNEGRHEVPHVDMSFWRWAVSVAACIIMAVLIPNISNKQSDMMPQNASVVTPCTIAQYICRDSKSCQSKMSVVETALPESVQVNEQEETENTYILVIASFHTLQEAEQYIQRKHVSTIFPSSGIARGGERYRVFAEKYQSKSLAVDRIQSFRAAYPQYSKAWVTYGSVI